MNEAAGVLDAFEDPLQGIAIVVQDDRHVARDVARAPEVIRQVSASSSASVNSPRGASNSPRLARAASVAPRRPAPPPR